jgi:hypothetical protein
MELEYVSSFTHDCVFDERCRKLAAPCGHGRGRGSPDTRAPQTTRLGNPSRLGLPSARARVHPTRQRTRSSAEFFHLTVCFRACGSIYTSRQFGPGKLQTLFTHTSSFSPPQDFVPKSCGQTNHAETQEPDIGVLSQRARSAPIPLLPTRSQALMGAGSLVRSSNSRGE